MSALPALAAHFVCRRVQKVRKRDPTTFHHGPTKNAIGFGELFLGKDIVDEAEFVAGLDQAAKSVLQALKSTNMWQKDFGIGSGLTGSK